VVQKRADVAAEQMMKQVKALEWRASETGTGRKQSERSAKNAARNSATNLRVLRTPARLKEREGRMSAKTLLPHSTIVVFAEVSPSSASST
jgi:division protein CdvB (Snf7/Vps24/ESCRT-III family)